MYTLFLWRIVFFLSLGLVQRHVHNLTRICLYSATKNICDVELNYINRNEKRKKQTTSIVFGVYVCAKRNVKHFVHFLCCVSVFGWVKGVPRRLCKVIRPKFKFDQYSFLPHFRKGVRKLPSKGWKTSCFLLCLLFHLHHCRLRLMSLVWNIFGL